MVSVCDFCKLVLLAWICFVSYLPDGNASDFTFDLHVGGYEIAQMSHVLYVVSKLGHALACLLMIYCRDAFISFTRHLESRSWMFCKTHLY